MRVRFNQQADIQLSKMFDDAEQKLVTECNFKPEYCDEYLTMQYIETCASFLEQASAFLEGEGRSASWIFLHIVAGSNRGLTDCAEQLTNWTGRYFPRFVELLTVRYLTLLNSTEALESIMRSGLVLLAVGTLPNAVIEVRRELRRRGLSYDRLLIPDDVLSRRLALPQIAGVAQL